LSWLNQTFNRDLRTPAAILAGMLFALALAPIWNFPTRWFLVVVVGIGMVSISLVFVQRLEDFLLVSHLLLLPLASFQKWLFLDGYSDEVRNVAPLSGAVSIGITELLLFGMYVLWFGRIFVAHTLPLPRLQKLDVLILLFLLTNLLSMPNAADPRLSVFAVMHLLRHFLFYFYFSRRLEMRHLRWVVVAFALAIAAESMLGVFQYKTGMLKGLILDKGADSEKLDYQYEVPGIEDLSRATGTSYDSHTFGLFLTMLLPFPLAVLLSNRTFGVRARLGSLALLGIGGFAVFVSFSRSAWLTCAITCGLVWLVFVLWGEKNVLIKSLCIALLALIPALKATKFISARFAYEGHQNLTARYDQFPVAWNMWKDHFFTGQGVGNYMVKLLDYQLPGTLELPVHNVFLWLAADTGLFGAIMFYVVIFAAMWSLGRVVRARRAPLDLMALGALAALSAYVIDGLTNPLFRESLVYMMFWLMLALSVALPRIQKESEEGQVAEAAASE
jgi:O-antigen ligase